MMMKSNMIVALISKFWFSFVQDSVDLFIYSSPNCHSTIHLLTFYIISPTYSYNSYYWADFESYSQEILEAMGYDQNSWDNGLPTEYDDMFWGKLPESVKEAAKELCYSAEIWNGIKSIDEWDDDVELPGSYSLYSENWLIALIQQLFAALLGLFS